MKRDITWHLEEWKKSHRRKPLILNGARQVGKTYSLKHFGKSFYEEMAYFNFEKDEKLSQYFKGTLDPKQLIKTLSIHAEIEIKPYKTLLILDEIQECPKALNSLKYFCEEANEYHIVAAGSLLGVKTRSEEHTSELQSHSFISYAVFCLKKKKKNQNKETKKTNRS